MLKNKSAVDWKKRIPKRVPFVDILPNELLVHILRNCGAKDLGKLSKVCRAFNDFIRDDIIWECLVKNGEHKGYFMTEPASQQLSHLVACFRTSLQLPINKVARMGRGKDFPYPTMFLHPFNIQGITLNTRAWLVLKEINKANTERCKELSDKLTNTLATKAVQEFYVDANKKIPRREHEKGLEIGGMFFDVDAIRIVATAFNEVFS